MTLAKQKGVVIVVALFVVALVAAMSYVMLARLERDTRRTNLILRDTQANLYAQGSVLWAKDTVRNDWIQKKPKRLVDATPIKSPVQNESGYQIVSTIYDMQAHFNLNNLTNKEDQENFKRLLTIVGKLSPDQAQQIVRATTQWITPGATTGELKKYYFQLPMPYRPAGRPMFSVTEWRLVKGVTPALYQAVAPYLTALPQATLVNVQTAPAPVLMMLSPTLPLDAARQIEQVRIQAPFITPEEFFKLDVVKNHRFPEKKITGVSHYFLVETEVTIENQHLLLYTLLMRKVNGKKADVNILWQSKGVW